MSHTTTQEVQISNIRSVKAAALAMGAELLGEVAQEHMLYGSNKAFGIAVKPKGWRYPIVLDLDKKVAKWDAYGCDYGTADAFTRFKDRYVMEELVASAPEHGIQVGEIIAKDDGSFELQFGSTLCTAKAGKLTTDVQGVVGESCKVQSDMIQQILGSVVTSEECKNEFYMNQGEIFLESPRNDE